MFHTVWRRGLNKNWKIPTGPNVQLRLLNVVLKILKRKLGLSSLQCFCNVCIMNCLLGGGREGGGVTREWYK